LTALVTLDIYGKSNQGVVVRGAGTVASGSSGHGDMAKVKPKACFCLPMSALFSNEFWWPESSGEMVGKLQKVSLNSY
jgi:hypothetical protein